MRSGGEITPRRKKLTRVLADVEVQTIARLCWGKFTQKRDVLGRRPDENALGCRRKEDTAKLMKHITVRMTFWDTVEKGTAF